MGKRKFSTLRPITDRAKLREIGRVLIGNRADMKEYDNPDPNHSYDRKRCNVRVFLDAGKPSVRTPTLNAIDADDLALQGLETALREATISVLSCRRKLAQSNEDWELVEKIGDYIDSIP